VHTVISGDEIGLWTARLDDVVLRNAYQLIFRRHDDVLEAVAAEGFLRPMREGVPLPPKAYLDGLDDEARTFASRVAAALHLANHNHIGLDGVEPVLALRREDSDLRGPELADMIRRADLNPSELICHFRDADQMQDAVLAAQSRDLSDLGVCLAVGPAGQPFLPAIRQVMPGVVAIGGDWFRRVCENAAALRLFFALVQCFKREGMTVWVEGIETRSHLQAACDAGADMLSGFLLCKPRLAGSDMQGVLGLSALLDQAFGVDGSAVQIGKVHLRD
jgi:hypothetical protein